MKGKKYERKKPINYGRNNGVMGRPRADPELVARAVAMVECGSHTAEEAALECGIGGNTVRRAMKAQAEKDAIDAGIIVPAEPEPVEVDLPVEVAAAVEQRADAQKARAVLRLVRGAGGTWDGATAESLAVTWGCTAAEIRALALEAAIMAGAEVLPPELAREEALAVFRHARDKAKTAADWKNVVVAQEAINKIQLPKLDPETMTRAQFVEVFRRVLGAVAGYPGAREAALEALRGAVSE